MRTEYLLYFPDRAEYVNGEYIGTAPQYYYLASSESDRRAAIDNGGRDVSDNDAHWREWERQANMDYMHG